MTYEIITILNPRQEAIKTGLQYYKGNPCKKGHDGTRLTKDGQCKECKSILRKKSNDGYRKRARKWELNKNFGITLEEYETLVLKQNNLCAICGKPEKVLTKKGKIKSLAVDHCHTTGKIRGLLCYLCNIAIGGLNHNPELLRKAALYCEAV